MNNIKQFLIEHPLLNVRAIEQTLGIPSGTIRIKSDRSIPDKFTSLLSELLSSYGYNNDVQTSVIKDKPIVQTSDTPTNSKDLKKYMTRKKIVGYMDGHIFKQANLPDNTTVYAQIHALYKLSNPIALSIDKRMINEYRCCTREL